MKLIKQAIFLLLITGIMAILGACDFLFIQEDSALPSTSSQQQQSSVAESSLLPQQSESLVESSASSAEQDSEEETSQESSFEEESASKDSVMESPESGAFELPEDKFN
jgi:cytoskeletal protein RodZ